MEERPHQILEEFSNTEWNELALSAPNRLVAAMRLGVLPVAFPYTNEYGDGPTSAYPALGAAYAAAKLRGNVWDTLVDAGVVDALCQLVISGVPWYLCPMPADMPESARRMQATPDLRPPPWLDPLSVLWFYFCYPGRDSGITSTTLKMVPIIRKYWTRIMKRIWDVPDSSLEPTGKHKFDRVIVATLFDQIMECDPSFHSVTYDPSDRTIAVISRFLTYSIDMSFDIGYNLSLLGNLLAPEQEGEFGFARLGPSTSRSRQDLAGNPPLSKLVHLRLALEGARTPRSSASFLATLASHFNLPGFGTEHAEESMNLLYALCAAACPINNEEAFSGLFALEDFLRTADVTEESEDRRRVQHKGFLKALRLDAQPLWTALFAAAVRHKTTDKLPRPQVIRIMSFVAILLLHSLNLRCPPRELGGFVAVLIRAGLFKTLDDTISIILADPRMCELLSHVIMFIGTTCAVIGGSQPKVNGLIRAELPRPRIVRAVYDHWRNGESTSIASTDDTPSNADERKTLWSFMTKLQSDHMDPSECGRRGCENRVTARCTACRLGYCGRECQKTDWKEHKLVCGLQDN